MAAKRPSKITSELSLGGSDRSHSTMGKEQASPEDHHTCVPLPIQSFLWRQTNPFLGPKVGRLHEASCVTFERVVVQNILHGLSPSLSDAIHSIPRWRFIRSTFPHIVQCSAALLAEHHLNKEEDGVEDRKLSNSLSKILYILHWMLIDSAAECNDETSNQVHSEEAMLSQFVFPINCVQIFVYLLGPLIHCLNESDIAENIRLESGLSLWRALWSNHIPELLCFSAPVKPRKAQLMMVPLLRRNIDSSTTAAQSIYLGEETSTTDTALPMRSISAALSSGVIGGSTSSIHSPRSPAQRAASPNALLVPDTLPPMDEAPEEKVETKKQKETKSVVRSVSEYKKRPADDTQPKPTPEHKPLAKATTAPEMDTSGAFRLGDLERHLKFVEEGSLNGLVEFSDKAPLVELQDICNGDSIGDLSPGSQCEVVCEKCDTVIYREGALVGVCKCSDRRRSSAGTQLKVVPICSPERDSTHEDITSPRRTAHFATSETVNETPSSSSFQTMTPLSVTLQSTKTPASGATSTTVATPTPLGIPEGSEDLRLCSSTIPSFGPDSRLLSPTTGTGSASFDADARSSNFRKDLHPLGAASTAGLVSWADSNQQISMGSQDSASSAQIFGTDPFQGSYFDVAVLRCLFIKHWSEDGQLWALKYYCQRLMEMQAACGSESFSTFRKRSSSEPPPPKFKVSLQNDSSGSAISAQESEHKQSLSKTDLELPSKDENRVVPNWQQLQLHPTTLAELNKNSESPTSAALQSPCKQKVAFQITGDTQDEQSKSALTNDSEKPLVRRSSMREEEEQRKLTVPDELGIQRRSSLAMLKGLFAGAASKLELNSTGQKYCPSSQRYHANLSSTSSEPWKQGQFGNSMARSYTDTNVSYSVEYMTEAVGSTLFIEKDGRIKLSLVLEAVNAVLERQTSLKICESSLTILDILLNMGFLPERKQPKTKRQRRQKREAAAKQEASRKGSAETTDIFAVFVKALFRIYLILGCPHGCNDGMRTPQADFLRGQARACLSRVQRHDSRRFTRCVMAYVDKAQCQRLLDLIHSFTGFCYPEKSTTVYRARSGSSPKHHRRPSVSHDERKAPSYKNNFLESQKGVEGALVNAVLKPLVTRLMEQIGELQQPENMGLYHDVRSLMTFVQDNHGNPFRRVELSAMIDGGKIIKSPDDEDMNKNGGETVESKSTGSGSDESGSRRTSPGGSLQPPALKEQVSLRRGLFRRQKDKKDDKATDDSDQESSSPGTPRTHHQSSEEQIASSSSPLLPSSSKKRSGKLTFALNLLKSVRTETQDDGTDISDSENMDQSMEDLRETSGDSLDAIEKQKTSPHISFKGNSKAPATLDVRTVSEEIAESERRRKTTSSVFGLIIPDRRLVNIAGVREGVRRFTFLLETCRPGSVPDPPLLAALLDLKSPILARAAILLECAHFIHRCNRGQWPEWIRSCVPSSRSMSSMAHALGNRGTPSGTRRTHLIQRAAGRMFYHWGEQVGKRLEEMLDAEKLTPEKLVRLPSAELKRRQLRIHDDLEDFTDEAIVNPSGEECPMALKLLACVLLSEITAFLRETFQTIPRSRSHSRPGLHPGWEKLMSHRRWSVLSSTFNPQQQSGSIQSIADLVAQLHPATVQQDRRVSFSTPEEESPQGSHGTLDEAAAPEKRAVQAAVNVPTPPTSVYRPVRQRTLPHQASLKEETYFEPSTVEARPRLATRVPSGGAAGQQGLPPTRQGSDTGRRLAQGRQRLLKRSSGQSNEPLQPGQGSQKKRASIRLKKRGPAEEEFAETAPLLTCEAAVSRQPSKRVSRGSTAELQPPGSELLVPDEDDNSLLRAISFKRMSVFFRKGSTAGLPTGVTPPRKESTRSARKASTGGDELFESQPPAVSPATEDMQHTAAAHAATSHAEDTEDDALLRTMPWLKVVVRLANSFNFVCTHQRYCHPNCYERVVRQSHRLMISLRKVHGEELPLEGQLDRRKVLMERWQEYQESKRKASQRMSAVPRRESAIVRPLTDRIQGLPLKSLLIEKLNEIEQMKESDRSGVKTGSQDSEEDEIVTDSRDFGKLTPMARYMKTHLQIPIDAPLTTVLKAAVVLNDNHFQDIIPVAWEMLLQSSHHVTSCAAAVLIVASVKQPEQVVDIIKRELRDPNPSRRTAAIVRFYALWRNRYHCWLKMEEGAHMVFKVSPPSIDFTLPSPPIGQSQVAVVDPPWMPHIKTKVEDLTLKEVEATSQSIMAMTKTRRTQKRELMKRAVREADEKQSAHRQSFPLLGTPVPQQAAYEPALFYQQSVPAAPQPSTQAQASEEDGKEETDGHVPSRHQVPVGQPLFPSCLLSVVPLLIEMLDDSDVDSEGCSVSEIAKKISWTCTVEDPALFLRHFLEKITSRDRQFPHRFVVSQDKEHLMGLLRKLLLRFRNLPSQTAYTLFNYMTGFIMYYVRSPCEGSQEAISMALSIIWLVAPSVQGLYFKDMKQTLRKEQCDNALMISANVPSAKKILVYGPDSTGIPSQFPIHEDTQFQQLLNDSLEFFNISEETMDDYFLVDAKSGLLHSPNAFVRDFYFFHRLHYPQLNLVHLDQAQAMKKIKEKAFTLKFIDMGKVLLTLNIVRNSPEHVMPQRIYFLHDELTRLASFPRKALEACFGMYKGAMGRELQCMDTLHKYAWIQLVTHMFDGMENPYMFGDLHLFINVINGVMILHCEDAVVLRRCMATYLNMAVHFNTLFATNGFFLIMPTILRCYSQRQTNYLLCKVIEFVCRQFYIIHRKPFLLQLFGSIANILDCNDSDFDFDPMRIKASYLFQLLLALEQLDNAQDSLDILALVSVDKPLKALDLCYRDDPNTFCILTDALASCVTICALAPDSKRCYQMLMIMNAILPHFVRRLAAESAKAGKTQAALKYELHTFTTLVVEFKALVNSCEVLARNFSGPQRSFDIVNVSGRGKSFMAESPQFLEPSTYGDEPRQLFVRNESTKKPAAGWETFDDSEAQRDIYRRPRDALLCLAACFLQMAQPRLKEIGKMLGDHSKIPEVLDHKSHVKLSEIALALLKLAPYDPNTMACQGLQSYFLHVLPVTDWSVEQNRSALNMVLRRLDKTFAKIGKKGAIKRRANWAALSNWLKGLHETISAFPYMAHLHPLKTTTQMCLKILIADPSLHGDDASSSSIAHQTSSPTILHGGSPPQIFCSVVLKLTSFLMQALSEQTFSLETICGPESLGPAITEKVEAVLCHIVIPLFLRAGTVKKDAPQLRQRDVQFCLNFMLNAVNPPVTSKQSLAPAPSLAATIIRTGGTTGGGGAELIGRQGSVSVTERGYSATVSTAKVVRDSICHSVILALKVMIVSFNKQLTGQWPKIAKIVRDLAAKRSGGQALWSFLDFVLSVNSPLTVMVTPIIQQKINLKAVDDTEAHWHQELREKLIGRCPNTKCQSTILTELAHELQMLKEDFINRPIDAPASHTPTIADLHSDSGSAQSIGGQRLSCSRRPSDPNRRLSFNAMAKRLAPGTFNKTAVKEPAELGETKEEQTPVVGVSTQPSGKDGRELQKSPSLPHSSTFKGGGGLVRRASTIRWAKGKRWRSRGSGKGTSTEELQLEREAVSTEHVEMQHMPRRTKSFMRSFRHPQRLSKGMGSGDESQESSSVTLTPLSPGAADPHRSRIVSFSTVTNVSETQPPAIRDLPGILKDDVTREEDEQTEDDDRPQEQ